MTVLHAKLEVYKDSKHEWRWRLIARNGRIVADSGEGYSRRAGAIRAAKALFSTVLMSWLEVAE